LEVLAMSDWIVEQPDGTIEEGTTERAGQVPARIAIEEDLTEPQVRVLAALLGGAAPSAAAEQAGVNRGTLYRWLNDPDFCAALNRAKLEHRAQVRGELRGLAATAVKTLRDLLEDTTRASSLRVKIALGVLKALGVAGAEEIGPTRPEALRAEWAFRDRVDNLRTAVLHNGDS
jgi:hypothetical protein